ncbi:hypothetical protein [Piscicoccus intestinalis]|uniref:hypothetical protein n=1 Tax=Piscicoccus intestinalis TaxID=746033 RepID=UPI0012EDB708|nr:hypothetical protein [Piscicoccus intestinalis]
MLIVVAGGQLSVSPGRGGDGCRTDPDRDAREFDCRSVEYAPSLTAGRLFRKGDGNSGRLFNSLA